MIKGAIFDLDGTLIDSMPVWMGVGAKYLKQRGITPKPHFYTDIKFIEVLGYADYMNREYGLDLEAYSLKDEINRMMEYEYFNSIKLKEGVREFVEALADKGVKLAVATATDEYLVREVLTRNGIYDKFTATFSCRDYKTTKDEPKLYETALAALGTKKEETFIFEDAVYAIKTANKAGFPICAIYDEAAQDDWNEITSLSTYAIESFTQGKEIFGL